MRSLFAVSARVLTVVLFGSLISARVCAETERYASGLLRRFSAVESVRDSGREAAARSGSRATVARAFLASEFKGLGAQFAWQKKHEIVDKGLSHQWFQLTYAGRPVVDRIAKVHVGVDGGVVLASSPLERAFHAVIPGDTAAAVASTNTRVRREFETRWGTPFKGYLKINPVVWVGEGDQNATAALEVVMNSFYPFSVRKFYVEEISGKVLEEKRVLRNASTTNNVYPINPSTTALSSVTIPNLDATTALSNSFLRVRREQNVSTPALVAIDPSVNFSAEAGFSTNPDSYSFTCTGSTAASCPNQGFDGVNVYYHINAFRQALAGYFTTLGVDTTLSRDPLDVIINLLISITNNAAYLDSACNEDGSVARCLLFLRPEPITDSRCGSGAVRFYDLAREANIAVHEFQHYVTDSLAGFVAGTSSRANVGDVLHEGYSDYFGTAFVSENSSGDASLVGEYAFQECTFFQREIDTIRPLENSAEEADDPHLGGHSFATGLWKLSENIGVEQTNLIALQSLMLSGVKPSSVDAIETLVAADVVVTGGENRELIKEIFFDQVGFTGGVATSFRDGDRKVREVGFRSCLGVSPSAAATSGSLSLLLLALWASGTWGFGRFWFRRRRD